jgi:putative SOS response-associated peptidase YedK
MVTTQSCAPLDMRDDRMPAILRNDTEIKTWLAEMPATAVELKALLRPYDGSLVMREQEPGGPPSKPKKRKAEKPAVQPSLDL